MMTPQEQITDLLESALDKLESADNPNRDSAWKNGAVILAVSQTIEAVKLLAEQQTNPPTSSVEVSQNAKGTYQATIKLYGTPEWLLDHAATQAALIREQLAREFHLAGE